MSVDYAPVLVALLIGVGLGAAFLTLAIAVGPRHVSAEKLAPFECGSEPIGTPRVRFSVKFYHVAILFLVFDVETAFLYPWAVLYRKLSCTGEVIDGVCSAAVSWFGLGEMVVFVAVLVVALAYAWRKKAIGWG